MKIYFHSDDVSTEIRQKNKIRKWICETIEGEGKEGDTINIILTGSKNIKFLNNKYLKRKYLTDIITFNYNRDNLLSGDLFINPETIKINAAKYKVKYSEELKRVIIHGVLHLIGYDDKKKEEKVKMREMENFYLNLF